ncbi:MAG: hypothetical protein MJE12_02895 [Alphaproteobacteria bacterium]|nr:hypothetical protein [Alphaproteobacteria bacterium]
MTRRHWKAAILLYLFVALLGGLVACAVVIAVDVHAVAFGGSGKEEICTPVLGNAGQIPIADSRYSCKIRPAYLGFVLLFFGVSNLIWTTLFGASVMTLIVIWRRLAESLSKGISVGRRSVDRIIVPNVAAMGLYVFSVVCLAFILQVKPDWHLLGVFNPVTCVFLLSPILLIAIVVGMHRGLRSFLFQDTSN